MGNNVGALKDSSSEAAEVKLAEARRLITECSDDELLQGLSRERDLFSLSNPEVIKLLIDELIRRKVYPETTPEENPNTVHQMVSGWGAYWHTWKGTLECPHCKVDLRDHKSGPPGVRQIGVIVEDRVAYWVCPDCKGTWDRGFNPKKPE
jgi:rubredoxin